MVSSALIVALAGLSSFTEAAPTLSKRGSSKLGYAFGKGAQSKIESFSPNPGCWGYDWEARADNSPGFKLPSSCEFVPMLHDDGAMFTAAWQSDAQAAIAAGSKHLLSFNEPDHCGPASEGGVCMPVDRAAAAHRKYVQPFADKGVKIGAPAVTNGNEANKGINYLTDFLKACSDCTIDFVCAHWQWNGADTPVQTFIDHITDMHTKTGKPVWVTEFQAPQTNANPAQWMKEAAAWMDKTDFVSRYAYWSVDAKLTNGNALNDLGAAYANL